MAGLAEAELTLQVGSEDGKEDKKEDEKVDEKALLKEWPLSSQGTGQMAEISKFMATHYPAPEYPKKWSQDWLNVAGVIPEQFTQLTGDSPYNVPMAVAVAMLYGWLPGKLLCPECKGTMRLRVQPHYKDQIKWVCNAN